MTLGQVAVTIDIKRNPIEKKSTKSDLPDFLQRFGQAIAEKEVSPIHIPQHGYYSNQFDCGDSSSLFRVRSEVISSGRNPMSKKSIFRALLEVILTSILILIIGYCGIFTKAMIRKQVG